MSRRLTAALQTVTGSALSGRRVAWLWNASVFSNKRNNPEHQYPLFEIFVVSKESSLSTYRGL